MKPLKCLFILCLSLTCMNVAAQLDLKIFALTDVSIIDALHPHPLAHQTVIVKGDRIFQVFSDGSHPLPDSIMEFNMHGKYLLPGLIDTHIHVATDPSETDDRASTIRTLNRMLYSGITSVRDMAGDARVLTGLSRDAKLGELISPDIYYSALMAGPAFFNDPRSIATARGGVAGGMPYMRAVSDTTDLVLAIAEAKGTGAAGIKLYAQFSAALVYKLVAEANRQHMRVWAHAYLDSARPSDLVKAGVSSLSHSYLLIYERVDSIPRAWKKKRNSESFWKDSLPDNTALFRLMKEHHTILDATLATYQKWAREDSFALYRYEITKRYTAAAYKAGVAVCAGTDDEQEGLVQNEMHLLVTDAGFTPFDAIIAATLNGARALGIDASTGTIEENKTANLLVLNKNPLDDIDQIKSVYLVIKSGRMYKK
jgi:imidazolonepropionase-like amidohydrolase